MLLNTHEDFEVDKKCTCSRVSLYIYTHIFQGKKVRAI